MIDYAFHKDHIGVPDLIGMVAAYIAMGHYPTDLEADLTKRLDADIARKAQRTFDLFDDWRGRGLWEQGPAMDDIKFTHDALIAEFPSVNEEHRRLMDPRSTRQPYRTSVLSSDISSSSEF